MGTAKKAMPKNAAPRKRLMKKELKIKGPVFGNALGKHFYAVMFIDDDELTTFEIWRANSEKQVMKLMQAQEDADTDREGYTIDLFEECNITIKKLGSVETANR